MDVQILPSEVLMEIFKWHIGECAPSRRLALVCKPWRSLILDTPTLWCNLYAGPLRPNPSSEPSFRPLMSSQEQDEISEKMCATLERRIRLSRSALLHIT